MRVIVWLTKRPGQNDGCMLLFDRRARARGIAVAAKRSLAHSWTPISCDRRPNCAKRKRTTRQTSDPTAAKKEREETERQRGGERTSEG